VSRKQASPIPLIPFPIVQCIRVHIARDRAIVTLQESAIRYVTNATTFIFNHDGEPAMSKSKDQKKQTKKEPSKTPKEKKELKKVKKEERKRG
jgi:hypothetical protein